MRRAPPPTAKCSRARARTPRRPRRPARRWRAAGRSPPRVRSAPISRWNAGPCAPTSPMSPSTSHFGAGIAAEHVDRGAHRIGIRVVGVVDDAGAARGAQAASRPATGAKRVEARGSRRRAATPIASAAVAAASAFATLCRPGAARFTVASPAGVASSSVAARCARRRTARARRPDGRARTRRRPHPARSRAASRHTSTYASSALITAMPSTGSARISSACSAATSPTVRMNSWCSRCALLTTATVGCAIAASSAVSPRWFMPSSIAATRCCARRASSVSGRPIALLRLPRVASTFAAPKCARRIDASISLTVVLPLLPAMTITGIPNRPSPVRRQRAERRERIGDGDQVAGQRARRDPRRPRAATAPRSNAAATKSWPSKRSPASATKRSPGASARVSVVTRSKRTLAPTAWPGDGAGGGRGVHHPALHRASAAAATSASEKCARVAVRFLIILVALAGDEHDVARACAPDTAALIAFARSRSTVQRRLPASRMPRTISLAIAAGSSLRGLSLVTITRSARRDGDASHLRALARVAVAAATEHADELAACGHRRAQRGQHLLQRVRRMRVVDDDQRLLARRPAAASGPAAAPCAASASSASASGTSLASSTRETAQHVRAR